jgi:superfamily II DNA or RNA helicase
MLRNYQVRARDEALAFLGAGQSCLLPLATGLGKTIVAAEVVKSLPGRVLWTVHRNELVRQAARELSLHCREIIGHETSEPPLKESGERIVVSSKDTIRIAGRLERLRHAGFKYLIIDEAHHAVAPSYRYIREALNLPTLLLTATPRRMDKADLGIHNVCSPMGTVEGIEQGWLVPVMLKRARIKSVDVSAVHTVGGDFAPGELDAIMRAEESLHGVVEATIEAAGDRPTLVFCTSVAHAQRMTELFLARGKTAACITGEVPFERRKSILSGFGTVVQFICSVSVLCEGIDLPSAACLAIARPTKSPTVMAQVLGRGLRPLKGVDNYETPDSRRDYISASRKPHCLVLDFVSATGRHRLSTAIDLLADGIGGKSHGAVVDRVGRRLTEDGTIDVLAAIRAAERDEEAKEERRRKERERREKAKIAANVKFEFQPATFGDGVSADAPSSKAATLDQIARLTSFGCPIPAGLTRDSAKRLITSIEQVRNVPSERQEHLLRGIGKWRQGITRKEATMWCNKFFGNPKAFQWRRY